MASFPTYDFTEEFVKTRFLEPFAGDAINVRALALPRGVYLGFIPQTTPGSDILVLATDPNHNFSKLSVGSQTRKMNVDLFTANDVDLNFNGHTVFPVYVIARADYRDKIATQAKILTRATTASGPQEVLICKVDKVGADLTVTYDFPDTRQPPIAFDGQVVGFMPDDAITDLEIGNSTRAEVTDARLSAHTTPAPHPSLADRIEADLVGPSMADRLGYRLSLLVGNLVTGVAGTATNVSGSFAATNREFAPLIDVVPGGTETDEGALTDPTDTLRNLCFVVDGGTGQRVVDSTSREPIYGSLVFTESAPGSDISGNVSGTINFYNGTTTVDGTGNPFASIQEGDLVKATSPPGDDRWYEIAEIDDANNATLGAAFQGGTPGGPAIPVVNPPFRRYTLNFFTVSGGAHSMPGGSSIRFLFPAFYRADRSIFDGWLLLKRNGELPPVPDATESTPGKALLAAPDGKVGSLRSVENNGTPVGNDYHTLNFVYGGASDAGLGVAEVSVIGAKGPKGADSNPGPTGPQGDPGYGFTNCNPFEKDSLWVGPGPTVSKSFTVDFSSVSPSISSIRHVWGGLAGLRGFNQGKEIRIDHLSFSGSTGRIDGRLIGTADNIYFKLWLGACE